MWNDVWAVMTNTALLIIVNFCVIVGFLWKGLSVLLSVRDSLRDTVHHIGTRHPPEGMLGDIEMVKREVLRQRQWLIELNAGLPEDHRIRIERT